MAVEICTACERLIDLDCDVEGAYDSHNDYYCFPCIEKNDWSVDEDTNEILKRQRYE